MALTGLEIYKHLPKTNCKKCGFPTCLAFAMALAGKKTSLDKCPDITEEAKLALESASQPPMATITIGTGEDKVEVGGETVLFRHEKTFYHPCAIGITLSDSLEKEKILERIEKVNKLKFERVGMSVQVNLIAISNESNSQDKFCDAIRAATEKSNLPLILVSDNPQALEAGLKICAEKKPLLYSTKEDNQEAVSGLAKKYSCPLVIHGKNLEELDSLSRKVVASGVKDVVLDPGTKNLGGSVQDFTRLRRLALKRGYRPVGYPVIAFVRDSEPYQEVSVAATYISKYANIVVLDRIEPEEILPLITLRQNIYTDPQKPIMVEPKLYEIGTPNENSPLLVTTNFSLTFFTVQPEIEASKVPSYLLIVEAEGLSVLTAWAAEKFTPEGIFEAMKKAEVEKKLSHKKIIIPGYVAVMKAKLEDESGWEVLVGPKEGSGIPKYLKQTWQ
ncbi:MAG: acetyl-CoA decarbonylase/synthase complex subunit gamma [Elusimicrobiota bacterium]|nr:acetyl-CoA decarbonylase/synthase complex subunit gamma [Elusimicrobiota bacterium]MDH5661838.1 acetyl-CoA decarbonylase/synthase complex subunit gamma [Elusimicrobiota bacterium]